MQQNLNRLSQKLFLHLLPDSQSNLQLQHSSSSKFSSHPEVKRLTPSTPFDSTELPSFETSVPLTSSSPSSEDIQAGITVPDFSLISTVDTDELTQCISDQIPSDFHSNFDNLHHHTPNPDSCDVNSIKKLDISSFLHVEDSTSDFEIKEQVVENEIQLNRIVNETSISTSEIKLAKVSSSLSLVPPSIESSRKVFGESCVCSCLHARIASGTCFTDLVGSTMLGRCNFVFTQWACQSVPPLCINNASFSIIPPKEKLGDEFVSRSANSDSEISQTVTRMSEVSHH